MTTTPATPSSSPPARRDLWKLSLAALGVVYGDIGTSPLYALRECFHGEHGLSVTGPRVLGVLSLVFWSLTVVISVKYLTYVMRADNRGEGGILALMALATSSPHRRATGTVVLLGLFGAALLYGDGIITPAISVLSAVEGLEVAAHGMSSYVVPLTLAILVGLFAIQRHGTAGVGAVFGPVTLLWFLVLGVLGAAEVARHPAVLAALSPHYAVAFLWHEGAAGFLVLGAVFLALTGGEALYADMGHFGARPIRLGWFTSFFGANVIKIEYGGWLPLLIAAAILIVMTTWRKGRALLGAR
ncbi:MAG TPA: KUP/HAK/KT family potassium transporter, partial [Polyangiaceae bacterium]|nr:KUP/HAK/KT family potassium transporter [Polyangiaceae bacterium]